MNRRVLAVFHGHGNHVLAPLLRDGFKHVFCALDDGNVWVRVDMMSGVPEIEAVAPSGFDLAAFYRDEGFTVVETEQGTRPPHGPLAALNCVGLTKIVLAIGAPMVLTPWQLFRYLRRRDMRAKP